MDAYNHGGNLEMIVEKFSSLGSELYILQFSPDNFSGFNKQTIGWNPLHHGSDFGQRNVAVTCAHIKHDGY